MNAATKRPTIRNLDLPQLMKYRLPAAGILSILHRVSGALMFLLLPFALWLFDMSLTSEISFERLVAAASNPLVKLVAAGLAWALIHHCCAGIRFLLLDLHIGVDKVRSRRSALVVFGVSLPLAAIVALKIFGAF